MTTHNTPNDLPPTMNQVGCIVLVPLIQNVLYPFLHRRIIYPRPIFRITIGSCFIGLSMIYAMIVQHVIYMFPPCYNVPGSCDYRNSLESGPNEVNVWIQTPIYFFIATGEIFAYVIGLEYAYDHAPKDMKVIVQAISFLLAGVG